VCDPPSPSARPPDDIPADIAAQVERAERRRAHGVKLLVLIGALLVAAGIVVYAILRHGTGRASPVVLGLLGAGFCVAFPGAALAALVLGPTWTQREQHYRSVRRERERP
jgi:hypothetical protein